MIKIIKYKTYIFFFTISLISFFYSVNQSLYNYDGFHSGLVLFSADGLNKNLIPYKEVFIHYGFLTTYVNSLILKLFDNNLVYIFSATSLSYSASLFILGILIKKFSSQNFSIIGLSIIFFLHPFTIYPWHSYYTFLLFNIFLILRVSDKLYFQRISYLFLSSTILFNESFKYASFLILLFDFTIQILKEKKINFDFFKNLLAKLFLYLIPIIIFFSYIFTNELFEYWKVYSQMPKVFLELNNVEFYEILVHFFVTLKNNIISNLFQEPHWIIYVSLIIFNILYLFYFFFYRFIKKSLLSDNNLALISFSSLVLLFQAAHSVTIFKMSCGLVVGFIVLFNFINSIKDKENKIIFLTTIFLLGLSCFEFVKNNSNSNYVYKYKKENFITNNYFDYFEHKKLDQNSWDHLIFTSKKIQYLKKNCKIDFAANISSDAFISVIMRDSIQVVQKIPWFEHKKNGWMNRYFNTFLKYYDKDLSDKINLKLEKKNIIIYTDRENFPILKIRDKKIDFSDKMNFLYLPYSYENKSKILIFPKICKNTI